MRKARRGPVEMEAAHAKAHDQANLRNLVAAAHKPRWRGRRRTADGGNVFKLTRLTRLEFRPNYRYTVGVEPARI